MSRRGFTLIELLVAVSIFAVAATAIYATFHTGMIAWRRIQAMEHGPGEWRVALRQLEEEIRNTVLFTPQPFTGESQHLEFPTVLNVYEPPIGRIPRLAIVSYSLKRDPKHSDLWQLVRRQWALGTTQAPEEVPVAGGVNRFDLSFARPSRDPEQPPEWVNHWAPAPADEVKIPLGIKIELGLMSQASAEEESLTKLVEIPIGSSQKP